MGELRVVELSPGLLAAEPGHHQTRDGTNEPHHGIMNVIGDHLRLSGYIMTCSVWVAGLLNLIPRTPRTAAVRAPEPRLSVTLRDEAGRVRAVPLTAGHPGRSSSLRPRFRAYRDRGHERRRAVTKSVAVDHDSVSR